MTDVARVILGALFSAVVIAGCGGAPHRSSPAPTARPVEVRPATAPVTAAAAVEVPTGSGDLALAAARLGYPACDAPTFDRWEDHRSAWIDVCGVFHLYEWNSGAFAESARTAPRDPVTGEAAPEAWSNEAAIALAERTCPRDRIRFDTRDADGSVWLWVCDQYTRFAWDWSLQHFVPQAPAAPTTVPRYDASGGGSGGGGGPVHVRGYYRRDGTYVRPHTRSRSRRR